MNEGEKEFHTNVREENYVTEQVEKIAKHAAGDLAGPMRYCSSASCHTQRETYYAGEDYEAQSLAGMQIKVKKGTLCCASCHEPISG